MAVTKLPGFEDDPFSRKLLALTLLALILLLMGFPGELSTQEQWHCLRSECNEQSCRETEYYSPLNETKSFEIDGLQTIISCRISANDEYAL